MSLEGISSSSGVKEAIAGSASRMKEATGDLSRNSSPLSVKKEWKCLKKLEEHLKSWEREIGATFRCTKTRFSLFYWLPPGRRHEGSKCVSKRWSCVANKFCQYSVEATRTDKGEYYHAHVRYHTGMDACPNGHNHEYAIGNSVREFHEMIEHRKHTVGPFLELRKRGELPAVIKDKHWKIIGINCEPSSNTYCCDQSVKFTLDAALLSKVQKEQKEVSAKGNVINVETTESDSNSGMLVQIAPSFMDCFNSLLPPGAAVLNRTVWIPYSLLETMSQINRVLELAEGCDNLLRWVQAKKHRERAQENPRKVARIQEKVQSLLLKDAHGGIKHNADFYSLTSLFRFSEKDMESTASSWLDCVCLRMCVSALERQLESKETYSGIYVLPVLPWKSLENSEAHALELIQQERCKISLAPKKDLVDAVLYGFMNFDNVHWAAFEVIVKERIIIMYDPARAEKAEKHKEEDSRDWGQQLMVVKAVVEKLLDGSETGITSMSKVRRKTGSKLPLTAMTWNQSWAAPCVQADGSSCGVYAFEWIRHRALARATQAHHNVEMNRMKEIAEFDLKDASSARLSLVDELLQLFE